MRSHNDTPLGIAEASIADVVDVDRRILEIAAGHHAVHAIGTVSR